MTGHCLHISDVREKSLFMFLCWHLNVIFSSCVCRLRRSLELGAGGGTKATAMSQLVLSNLCSDYVPPELFMGSSNIFSTWANPHCLPQVPMWNITRKLKCMQCELK